MEQSEFAAHLDEALAHLYDYPGLQTNPLARALVPDAGGEPRGRVLQRVILEAIQELRPSAAVSPHSIAWRKYRYLSLRYAEALDLPQTAEELGISTRQARRGHAEAVAALVSLLWDRYQSRAAQVRAAGTEEGSREALASSQPQPGLVDREVARLESTLEQQAIDLRELIGGVQATIARLASGKGVTLTLSLPDEALLVSVDRGVLREALVNLLILVIEEQATPVTVSATSSQSRVEVLVRAPLATTNPGEAVAQSRTRVRALRLEQDGRVQMSRRLVEMHGGSLRVLPTDGGEVAICLELPRARMARVLIVDDNPGVIQLFERCLAGGAYEVISATSGAEALVLARESRPDLITLDVMMPSRDGWEILQLLKGRPETAAIPVIVCSVLRDAELARSLGASGFLTKPVSRAELLRALTAALASPASE